MLVFVDCEAYGNSPVTGRLTEFGAVAYLGHDVPTERLPTFHGVLLLSEPDPSHPAVPLRRDDVSDASYQVIEARVFREFHEWLTSVRREGYTFVSDNVAFDWQWINCGFWRGHGQNPFGHSGRRISDFYAGLVGDWQNTQKWKRLRITAHDHNPVHDALGNVEAYRRMVVGGER